MGQIIFATNSYQSSSLPLSAQRLVNLYMETEPPDAKSQTPIFGAPGLSAFATAGNGPIRGARLLNGTLYAVSGESLYSITAKGVATLIPGTIAGAAVAQMSDNGTQLCMIDGFGSGDGYIYTTGGGLVQITDPNYLGASSLTYFDEFFVFAKPNSNVFFASNQNDGTTYNALAYGVADTQPGNIRALLTNHETLLVFTDNVIETWYDAGTYPFPFARYDGATIERGCSAGGSVIKEDNTAFFLGNDGIFYRLFGTLPMRISTHAIEAAWRKYPTVADCVATTYTIDGHKCIILTFPAAQATWVCDLSAKNRWHERVSWNPNNTSLLRWRANQIVPAFGRTYVGDAFSGAIGLLDPTAFTEYGNTIQGYAISAPIHQDRKRITHQCLELDMETGVGLPAGQGSNPSIVLDWSDDGGRTFKPIQLPRSFGAIGQTRTRVRWLRLGQSRVRYYRIQITDPVKRTIIAADLTSEVRD